MVQMQSSKINSPLQFFPDKGQIEILSPSHQASLYFLQTSWIIENSVRFDFCITRKNSEVLSFGTDKVPFQDEHGLQVPLIDSKVNVCQLIAC
jgi:hypothetical protein